MRTIQCIGYEGYPCGKTVKATSNRQLRCSACVVKIQAESKRKWDKRHRQQKREYDVNHRKQKRENHRRWRQHHPELITVIQHHRVIFKTSDLRYRNYKGMPFFDGWNPDKSGSFKAGEQWIIQNISKRPKGCSLHVVDHEKGFVPGNLEWTYPKKQIAKQMFKIIADQRHEIEQLKQQIQKLKLVA